MTRIWDVDVRRRQDSVTWETMRMVAPTAEAAIKKAHAQSLYKSMIVTRVQLVAEA